MLNLREIEDKILTPVIKGFPSGQTVALKDIGKMNWNLLREDVQLPVALLKDSAIHHNQTWMSRFVEATGVLLSPHGKTTMSPHLFDLQLQNGAWGITAATTDHVRIYRRYGVKRIFYANQLIGKQNIKFILDELKDDPEFDFYCLVDSKRLASILANAVRDHGLKRPLQVLVEVGLKGGRTGVRDYTDAMDLARIISAHAPYLSLRGAECFEGVAIVNAEKDPSRRLDEILHLTVQTARQAETEGLFAPGPVILSAGGSSHFDVVSDRFKDHGLKNAAVVIRSGCYISHDSLLYAKFFQDIMSRHPEFETFGKGMTAALEVWGYIQSIPEEGLAICTLGKRDVSYDTYLPVPKYWFRPGHHTAPQKLNDAYAITALNDQHAYIKVPADHPFQVGDMVGVGVSHPCTTFDKWQLIYRVDDAYNITGAIHTFF